MRKIPRALAGKSHQVTGDFKFVIFGANPLEFQTQKIAGHGRHPAIGRAVRGQSLDLCDRAANRRESALCSLTQDGLQGLQRRPLVRLAQAA